MTKTNLKHSREGAFTGKSGCHSPCIVLPFEGPRPHGPSIVDRKVPITDETLERNNQYMVKAGV
jgi:hypothetical protein